MIINKNKILYFYTKNTYFNIINIINKKTNNYFIIDNNITNIEIDFIIKNIIFYKFCIEKKKKNACLNCKNCKLYNDNIYNIYYKIDLKNYKKEDFNKLKIKILNLYNIKKKLIIIYLFNMYFLYKNFLYFLIKILNLLNNNIYIFLENNFFIKNFLLNDYLLIKYDYIDKKNVLFFLKKKFFLNINNLILINYLYKYSLINILNNIKFLKNIKISFFKYIKFSIYKKNFYYLYLYIKTFFKNKYDIYIKYFILFLYDILKFKLNINKNIINFEYLNIIKIFSFYINFEEIIKIFNILEKLLNMILINININYDLFFIYKILKLNKLFGYE